MINFLLVAMIGMFYLKPSLQASINEKFVDKYIFNIFNVIQKNKFDLTFNFQETSQKR